MVQNESKQAVTEGPNEQTEERTTGLMDDEQQKRSRENVKVAGYPEGERGEALKAKGIAVESLVAERGLSSLSLLEEMLEASNREDALERVKENKGSAGIDGLSVKELPEYVAQNWSEIKAALMEGRYKPKPVKRVEIPKPNGGMRQLGIPTVLDRFIQQMVMQTLQRYLDETFSGYSYGFRPGKSAHQAVLQAQEYVRSGLRYVVDIDLEKFFDNVNHDILMGRLAKRIGDKRVLKLIRAFLKAGVMENGLVSASEAGTPQGGPLSPLLSNVLLDELDKELEKRGHRFVRYADDCNIYVSSEKAGKRVMEGVTKFLWSRLKLKVNEEKSKVGRPWLRKFLGFSFTRHKESKRRIAPEAIKRFKERVRKLTCRKRGNTLEEIMTELRRYLLGWRGYFRLCETPSVLEKLNKWTRRRLRSLMWTRWKTSRNRYHRLRAMGMSDLQAKEGAGRGVRGPWRMSRTRAIQTALTIKYFEQLGLPRLCSD